MLSQLLSKVKNAVVPAPALPPETIKVLGDMLHGASIAAMRSGALRGTGTSNEAAAQVMADCRTAFKACAEYVRWRQLADQVAAAKLAATTGQADVTAAEGEYRKALEANFGAREAEHRLHHAREQLAQLSERATTLSQLAAEAEDAARKAWRPFFTAWISQAQASASVRRVQLVEKLGPGVQEALAEYASAGHLGDLLRERAQLVPVMPTA